MEGIYTGEDIKEIRKNAIHAGLKLVDCPIRHLGTEKAQELYLAIQNYLADNGVEMRFNTECENIILEEEGCKGVLLKDGDDLLPVYADEVVIGTGRRGADWLEKLCAEHHIAHKPGTVDIGVRVECRNEVMEKVNKVLYESKLIGYPKPWKNKVRTFCQNPGGFVAQENYDNDLAVVNGHSFKEKKSPNTNLAILVSHNFTEPFNQPIAYAQKVGELTNMLGAGHIMVQRYGDILDGKRTWQKELAQSNVKPTLKDAVAGDITAAMPYRAMTNIIEFIKMLDMVVPGFAANETLLYSPELKFYSNKVKMDENLDTNIKGLHCLGDSSGWTRGLMMASVMGVLMGRKLAEKRRLLSGIPEHITESSPPGSRRGAFLFLRNRRNMVNEVGDFELTVLSVRRRWSGTALRTGRWCPAYPKSRGHSRSTGWSVPVHQGLPAAWRRSRCRHAGSRTQRPR